MGNKKQRRPNKKKKFQVVLKKRRVHDQRLVDCYEIQQTRNPNVWRDLNQALSCFSWKPSTSLQSYFLWPISSLSSLPYLYISKGSPCSRKERGWLLKKSFKIFHKEFQHFNLWIHQTTLWSLTTKLKTVELDPFFFNPLLKFKKPISIDTAYLKV